MTNACANRSFDPYLKPYVAPFNDDLMQLIWPFVFCDPTGVAELETSLESKSIRWFYIATPARPDMEVFLHIVLFAPV